MSTYKGLSTFNRFKKFRLTDFELAKQDLYNHFNIRKGEKLMNPNFGTIIWGILFEPFTEEIKAAITKDITSIVNYDPRLSVDNINVVQFDYGIQVSIDLTYIPTDQRELLTFNFEQGSKSVSVA